MIRDLCTNFLSVVSNIPEVYVNFCNLLGKILYKFLFSAGIQSFYCYQCIEHAVYNYLISYANTYYTELV